MDVAGTPHSASTPGAARAVDCGAMTTNHLDGLLARLNDTSVVYWKTLGITVDAVHESGRVTLSLSMRPDLGTRRADVMHGGAIASLIDAAAGAAVLTLIADGDETYRGQATLDLNVTFLNAATTDVHADAQVLRSSRALAFTSVDVRDASGALVAVGRATYSIIRAR